MDGFNNNGQDNSSMNMGNTFGAGSTMNMGNSFDSTSSFNSNTQQPAPTTVLGQDNSFAYNNANTESNPFSGNTMDNQTQSTNSFGQSVDNSFSQPMDNSFSQPMDNSFSQPMDNSFSQTVDNSFGQPADNSFGQPADNSFGQPADNSFGQPTDNSFGQPADNGFGQPANNGFGQPANNGFGQPANNNFNNTYASTADNNFNNTYSNNQYSDLEQPVYMTEEKKASKGAGIAGLILGILGLLCSCCYGFGAVLGIVALILGIVQMKKNSGKGFGIASLIIGIVDIVGGLVMLLVLLFSGNNFIKDFEEGFMEGYNGATTTEYSYNTTTESNYTTEDTEDSTDATNSTVANNNAQAPSEMHSVYVNGSVYTLPIKVSDLNETINTDDIADKLSEGVEPGSTIYCRFDYPNMNYIFSGNCINNGSSTVNDANELYLKELYMNYYWDDNFTDYYSDFVLYGNISIGSSESDVKAAYGSDYVEDGAAGSEKYDLYYYFDDCSYSFEFENGTLTSVDVQVD